LIGSAQARRFGGVLQHGSLPLFGSLTRITDVLAFKTEEERRETVSRVLEHAITLSEAVEKLVTYEQASSAFIQGFQEELDIHFIFEEPSKAELELARQLLEEKYNNTCWNLKN
jgi:lipoate-protein ligase A